MEDKRVTAEQILAEIGVDGERMADQGICGFFRSDGNVLAIRNANK
jgi:hypothetical protein